MFERVRKRTVILKVIYYLLISHECELWGERASSGLLIIIMIMMCWIGINPENKNHRCSAWWCTSS